MIQTKRILFSAGVGAITLIALIVLINPFGFDFNFTGFVVKNNTLNGTKPLLESLAETTSTTSVASTTTTKPLTTTVTKQQTTTSTPVTTTTILSSNHVVFSEIFYDTPGVESDEEWIELYNPTTNSIDISGLKIEDKNDNYLIPSGTIIDHNDFLVIARNKTGFNNLYGSSPDISGLTLSLNNDGDVLRLKNGSEEIDMVAWENYISGWNLIADGGESIQRDPPARDTDTSSDWISHIHPDPDTGGLITTTTTTTSTTVAITTLETTSTTSTTSTTTISLIPLSLSVTAEKDPIVRGNNQTIFTLVTDGVNPIEGAFVNVTVKYASNTTHEICTNGLTNSTGIHTCSWVIGGASTPGTFVATSKAIKNGYSLAIRNVTFQVTEAP